MTIKEKDLYSLSCVLKVSTQSPNARAQLPAPSLVFLIDKVADLVCALNSGTGRIKVSYTGNST